MNKSPHWAQEKPHGHLVIDGAGCLVADCARPEDARRIVACVNACEGISTEQLDSWLCMSRPILQSMKELKSEADREAKQRDDLLAALQQYGIGFTDEAAARAEFGNYEVDRELKRRAAIAKATGEQP